MLKQSKKDIAHFGRLSMGIAILGGVLLATSCPGRGGQANTPSLPANLGEHIQIPKGNSIIIDGKLSDDEWKGALRQELKNGGEVYLMQNGSHLLVGVKGLKDPGWTHVYVTDGKDIQVLHASAALGAMIYRQSETGIWQPVQQFKWELRDKSQSAEALAARAAYLETNGWVASTWKMGNPAEYEFKVSGRFRQGNEMSLVVVYADDAKSPQFWPKSVIDDCLKEELIFGKSPAGLKFNRENWAKLVW